MARNTSNNPVFQVWRQRRGSSPELLAVFHSNSAAKVFLLDMQRREQMRGKNCADNYNCGGFLAYVGDFENKSPRAHYWWEIVITDEAINSESPPIYMDLQVKMGEVMIMGAVHGRAMREAAAAGINYEPDEGA